jgi:hypothetical protein
VQTSHETPSIPACNEVCLQSAPGLASLPDTCVPPGPLPAAGTSTYVFNPKNGRINRHIDTWDSIQNQVRACTQRLLCGHAVCCAGLGLRDQAAYSDMYDGCFTKTVRVPFISGCLGLTSIPLPHILISSSHAGVLIHYSVTCLAAWQTFFSFEAFRDFLTQVGSTHTVPQGLEQPSYMVLR